MERFKNVFQMLFDYVKYTAAVKAISNLPLLDPWYCHALWLEHGIR